VALSSSPLVAVVGAGPAGLMAADVLAEGGAHVTIYDQMPSAGRKFLLAGRGGLNLTHSEELAIFLTRYGVAEPRLSQAIAAFPPAQLRDWCARLGQETFVGSSGRVFPKAFKTSPLLRAWLRRLGQKGVAFAPRHRWLGFDGAGAARFATPNGDMSVNADAFVLALGGASWSHLGSDGRWAELFAKEGLDVASLRPANCGFSVAWSEPFKARFEGEPLKGIALSFDDRRLRGEAVITRAGIEGGGIYALSAPLREAILARGDAILEISLRADVSVSELAERLAAPRGKQSLSTYLRKVLKLSPVAIGLLQEASRTQSRNVATMSATELAKFIVAVPVRLTGTAPIARAISTAGGVSFDEIDDNFMLRQKPGVFIAGEMLDWEAPTGGYLLQGCFSTGAAAGRGALAWILS
jgi:uncharacterized flavoprotein (TIGR03862 family)